MADGIMDFFSKEAGQARTKARDEFIDGILGAARRAADYYLGPTGIPDRASSAGRVAAEMNPVVGIMDAMQASGEGRYGDAALETAMALAPAYGVTKAARPVSEAVQEVLLGGSAAAGDAGRAFVERMNQRGPMPTVYSNPLMRADDTISISDAIEAKYPDVSVDLYGSPERGYELSRIVVPEGKRGSGVGSKVMKDMINMADSQGAKISLTPDTSFGGTSVSRLKDFYKRFGFVENKGKNKDFSTRNTMYREPQKPSLLPARNEAEAMAKRILDMRAAGNAADVTDEMMAQADPQYMFYNTPLPMDEASRMERAREMGFDDKKPRYHGSDLDLSYLDPDMGSGERYRTGVFSTDNPDVADSYVTTRGGEIYPIITRRNDSGATINASGENWNKIPQSAPASLSGSVLEQEFPELYSDVSITAYDVAPYLYADLFGKGASTNALARQRRFEGDSNITFQNLVDRGPAIKRYLGETKEMQKARELSASKPSEVRVDFYGNQIRSPFARFDPAFAHLKNLSAATGIPITGLLGYSMLQDEQQ